MVEMRTIIYKTVAIIIFAALFPVALTTLFAVDVGNWTYYNPTTGASEPNTLAITLWNLIGWIILIFGGIMIWVSEK